MLAAQAVICAEAPSLHQRKSPVNPWQDNVCGHLADDAWIVASFAGASAEESVFDDSKLVLADMSSGVFDRSSFRRTKLILSDAQSASFLGATLTNANLYGTHLAKSLLWGQRLLILGHLLSVISLMPNLTLRIF